MRQWPLVVSLAGVGLGVVLSAGVGWEPGLVVVALALLLAGGLRMWLPEGRSGLLQVRSRGLDVAVLAGLGGLILLLAVTLPS